MSKQTISDITTLTWDDAPEWATWWACDRHGSYFSDEEPDDYPNVPFGPWRFSSTARVRIVNINSYPKMAVMRR